MILDTYAIKNIISPTAAFILLAVSVSLLTQINIIKL